jgi:peptide-methionine (S)-S-oxide reductase
VYDPAVITYERLLDVFWDSHEPCSREWSRQYRNAALTVGAEQRREALASRDRVAADRHAEVRTAIEPLGRFWPGELYHQKYRLQHERKLWAALVRHFGSDWAVVDSTVAARLNGALAGYGSQGGVADALQAAGFDAAERAAISADLGAALR